MRKKITWGLIIALLAVIVVYLFFYPADYRVTFKAKGLPGTINQTLKAWNVEIKGESITQNTINNLEQVIKFGDSVQVYDWHFETVNDSISTVTVNIKDKNHSLLNRIKKPFIDIPIKQQASKTVSNFYEYLKEHLTEFKVTYNGKADLQSTYCAYVPLKGKQSDKAKGMMQNYNLLASVMGNNNVKLNGPPFVEVTHWDIQTDSIAYNFCFPIIRSDKLPNHPIIKYKRIFANGALKATYNGNYITSDRAWYLLLKKAKDAGEAIKQTPIEYFYNNPNFGGNELRWKAEIFMPIKK